MERITYFADVIIPLALPKKYTYRIPVELNESVIIGKRVLVQFGKSKVYSALVYSVHTNAPTEYTAKYIDSVLDEFPVVPELQLKLWDWMSFYYMCGPGEVMNAALPSSLKLSSISHIQLNPDFNFEECEHNYFTDKEHDLIEALHNNTAINFDEAASVLKLKSAHKTINDLIKKNAIQVYEEVKDKFKPKIISCLKLNPEYESEQRLKEILDKLEKKAFKQAEALLYFLHLSKTSETKEWIKKTEVQVSADYQAINALVKKQILIEQLFEAGRLMQHHIISIKKELTKPQQQACNDVKSAFEKHDVVLLHGVTGSGKTEIYTHLIESVLKEGRQVLFLLPEIALTTQLITRMRAYFGDVVGVYHSRFSENERVEIWKNVIGDSVSEATKYKIILGARSALFLPFDNLGLIVVDEEHDFSYKQNDPAPRYHARDTAVYLATLHRCKVLLGSGTPSLESYRNAMEGKFGFVELKQRYTTHAQNETILCDVKQFEFTHQKKSVLTPPLYEAVKAALKNKEQIILFQNRRGFAPYTQCSSCGWVPHCVQCDVSLIYHKQANKLQCHYCGYSVSPPATCSACGQNDLRYKGLGTEKIEEEIEILFPEAKIARMDLDTTRSKFAYKQMIDDFEERNIDILIGTQMVTKGLDFDYVSVAGILNADSLLSFPDFRSHERAYHLITQVSGRAGRKHVKGKVFIQTSQPSHPLFHFIINSNIKSFYNNQLAERQQYFYPPFSRLIELNIVSKDIQAVNNLSEELAANLKVFFGKNILGPQFPLVSKIKNRYYKRLLIKTNKTSSPSKVREIISNEINLLHQNNKTDLFKVQVDVDPF